MRMSISQMADLKKLISMKINTYHSRMTDVVIHCKHPQNILSIANKFGSYDRTKDIEELRVETLEILNNLKKECHNSVLEADHPHEIVKVSKLLDSLIDDCY